MTSSRNAIYFISDAHLGSGNDSPQRERCLCALLDSIKHDAATLVLLGDMFDFWFTYKHVVPKGHIRLLGKLAELADAGVKIHYFIGNHDMWLFEYLSQEIGAEMHADPEIMTLNGERFLIGHGDGLGGSDPSYNRLRRMFRNRLCQRLFSHVSPSITFPIARRWSDSNKLKHQRENLDHYLGEEKEGIIIYIKERLVTESVTYCVFGHRHTPLDMTLQLSAERSVQYVNTGDWLYHKTYARYADGKLSLLTADR